MIRAIRLLALAALPSALAVAACAPSGEAASSAAADQASPQPQRRCFQTGQVNNFRADQQTVYVKVGTRAVYELSAAGACPDADTAFRIAMVAVDGGSSLCVGDMVTLVVPDPGATIGSCRARIDRQLTDEQIAALPERLRP